MPPALPSSPWRSTLRLHAPLLLNISTLPLRVLALLVPIAALLFITFSSSPSPSDLRSESASLWNTLSGDYEHPIDDLVEASDEAFRQIWDSHGTGVAAAAAKYREKRGRHPPPGFDDWYSFAAKRKAVVAEDIFDQIYHDLEPFWSRQPQELREETASFPFVISVRNHSSRTRFNNIFFATWPDLWKGMIDEFEEYLPDVDIAINTWDEQRVYVPWKDISKHYSDAIKSRHTDIGTAENPIINAYPSYDALSFETADVPDLWPSQFNNTDELWDLIRETCPPESRGRSYPTPKSYSGPPQFESPEGTHHGYVKNWTRAMSICDNPQMRNIHGALVAPRNKASSTTLFPVFSGCKLQGVNNDIILPGAMYYSRGEEYSGANDTEEKSNEKRQSIAQEPFDATEWKNKKNAVIWRGQATGGASKPHNWRHLHRHRFISMLNGTQVTLVERSLHNIDEEQNKLSSQNFVLPDGTVYPLSALQSEPQAIGEWVSDISDGAFTHFMCDPWDYTQFVENKQCEYLDAYYEAKDTISMQEQFTYKYLPDVDGYSFSGRYRAFLRSNSVPIKATLFTEWHDARLTPWKHFVPMDNTFIDWWGILEYFVGYNPATVGARLRASHGVSTMGPRRKGRDKIGKRIASEGRDWAEKALRTDDMVVYMFRLLLEWARICSKDRVRMGYVGDLITVDTFD